MIINAGWYYYLDTCVKLDGLWYFKERRFSPWKGSILENWREIQRRHQNELTTQWYTPPTPSTAP